MDVGTVITNSLYSILNKCLGSQDMAIQVVQDFIHTTVKELKSQQVLSPTVSENKQVNNKFDDESFEFEPLSPRHSICSSSTSTSPSPYIHTKARGRPRIFDDQQRKLRKNASSKRSRERHHVKIQTQREKLNILIQKQREIAIEKTKIEENIRKYRSMLCDYCLNIVDNTLKKIEDGEDFIYLRHKCQGDEIQKRIKEEMNQLH